MQNKFRFYAKRFANLYVVTKINQNKVQFIRKSGAQCDGTEQKELSF